MSEKFRLETVLRVAAIRERQRERDLALALRDDRLAEERVGERVAAYGNRPLDVRADAGTFMATREVVSLRARAVTDAHATRQAAAEELGAARDQWMVATRDRRALDELRQRHQAAQAILASRASQRALDDLAKAKAVMS